MIHLAASDLDGTLFTSNGSLPPDFWQVVDAMHEKGAAFAVASGRSYSPLKMVFSEHPEKLVFICDNGACVVKNDQVIYKDPIAAAPSKRLFQEILEYNRGRRKEDELIVLLCGVHGTYHMDYGAEYAKNVAQYYNNQKQVESLLDVDDEIYKAAIYDPLNPQTGSHAYFAEKLPDLSFQVSGQYWMDVMNTGTDKGKAVQMIANQMGISKSEIAVFGDFYNDLSLFREAEHSYCMANGDPGVKQYARYIAPSNDEYGVTELLKKICALDMEEIKMNQITKASDREVTVNPNKAGGVGHVDIEHLIAENQKNDKTKMFARVIIPAGSSLGYHEHHGESETYYILSGEGQYNDNGKVVTVSAGDVTFTPDGCGHGMENNGNEDLIFIALIQCN